LFAVQLELEVAARDLRHAALFADQVERPAVPKHDAAAAVLALRDVAFEIAVTDGMVLNHRCEVLHGRIERRAFRDRPRFQRAIDFEAEIVVQPACVMPLNEETTRLSFTLLGLTGLRLRSSAEIAFL